MLFMTRPLPPFLLIFCAVLLASCATSARKSKPFPEVRKAAPLKMYEWSGDNATGPPSIIIRLDEQKAYFFRGKKQVGWTYVASGKPTHPTPPGQYYVMERTTDKVSNLYGMLLDAKGDVLSSDFNAAKDPIPEGAQFKPAKMPYYARLSDDGVGMHAGKIPKPGATASHGCIRLPNDMAKKFFENVRVGTPVTILAGPVKKRRGLFALGALGVHASA